MSEFRTAEMAVIEAARNVYLSSAEDRANRIVLCTLLAMRELRDALVAYDKAMAQR